MMIVILMMMAAMIIVMGLMVMTAMMMMMMVMGLVIDSVVAEYPTVRHRGSEVRGRRWIQYNRGISHYNFPS